MSFNHRKSSSRRSASHQGRVLECLYPTEVRQVLAKLLDAHPELRREAEAYALEMFRAEPFEGTAELLAVQLRDLGLVELDSRAGLRDLEYMDPHEAGLEACQEVLDLWLVDMHRQLQLGLEPDALETLRGIVLGLYLVRNDKADGCLAWAPGFPARAAEEAVIRWRNGWLRRHTPSRKSVDLLLEFVADHAPEWKDLMEHLGGRLRIERAGEGGDSGSPKELS